MSSTGTGHKHGHGKAGSGTAASERPFLTSALPTAAGLRARSSGDGRRTGS